MKAREQEGEKERQLRDRILDSIYKAPSEVGATRREEMRNREKSKPGCSLSLASTLSIAADGVTTV